MLPGSPPSPVAAAGRSEESPCLEVSRDGEPFATFVLDRPLVFEVSWIHSVEHEEWREEFVADPAGEIRVEATRFRTFGAGVPDSAPETRLEEGWVVMRGFDRVVDPLLIRANQETFHTFTLDDEVRQMEPGQYRFSVSSTCTTSD
ncbi:MAG: DUF1850 domain-containing protein [Alkalispirochaeta sp.]